MPAPVALALCTALVLFLLRREALASRSVSPAIWIPVVWMMAMAGKSLAMWFDLSGNNEEGSLPDRLLVTGLGLAALVVVLRRNFDWRKALSRNLWLLALLAYMLLSTLWSDLTMVAMKRWIREVVVVLMALVVMSEAKPREALESLLRKTAYILIPYSVLLIKYYPAFGVDYGRWSGLEMWVGVTVHKNTLGRLCLLSAFFLIWELVRRWRQRAEDRIPYAWAPDLLVLAAALHLLRGAEDAYSATSIVTLAVGLCTLLLLSRLKRLGLGVARPVLLGALLFFLSLGVTAPFVGGSNLSSVSSTVGRDETLTGRTDTWAELVPVVQRRPLTGVGFGSFWTTERRDYYEMSHGHNGYLDTLLELGALGLLLHVAWLMTSVNRLCGVLSEDDSWGVLAIGFIVMAVVYNFAESTLNSLAEQMTVIVVLAAMVVPNEPDPSTRRSRWGMRLHVPAQRPPGALAAEPGTTENGGPLRVLDRRHRQRLRRPRPSRGRGDAVGTGAGPHLRDRAGAHDSGRAESRADAGPRELHRDHRRR